MVEAGRVLYLDLVGGVAGDMLLAALLDAGAPESVVAEAIAAVGLTEIELKLSEANPAGLRARRVDVLVRGRLGDGGAARSPEGDSSSRAAALREASGPVVSPVPSPVSVPSPSPVAAAEPGHVHDRPELLLANAPEPPNGAHLHVLGRAAHHPAHHAAHGPEARGAERSETSPGSAPRPQPTVAPPLPSSHGPSSHGVRARAEEANARDPGAGGVRPIGRSFRQPHALPLVRPRGEHRGHEAHVHRPYRVIREMLEQAPELEPRVREIALSAFRLLATAEGHVHGMAPEDVELHEVGSDDAIADIVGAAAALVALDIHEVVASPVPLGRGLTVGSHGPIPLPGPATLELLRGVPVEGTELQGETVTPTGAALLRAITTRFGKAPAMTIEAVGVGAGHRAWPDRPNVVRAIVGRASGSRALEVFEECVVEANIDDMSPEHLGALKRTLFAAGAIDVWSAPIAMKKDRLGVLVSALARRTLADVIASTFFTHSTTLGVRLSEVSRIRAERRLEEVETPYGRVRVKIAERPSGPPLVAPEYDDLERLAEASGVSIRAVSEAALKAAWAKRDA